MPSKRRPASRRRRRTRAPSRRVKRPASGARAANKQKMPADSKRLRTESGLSPEMQALNAYLAVANVNASMEFLERVFGFSRGVVVAGTHGQPRYAEMRHGDSVVMLIPKGDSTSATGGAPALYTYVGDVDKALTKARAAGAGVSEAEDRPWGDRTATVTDPDGYRWVLATFKKLVPFG
jgi:PhnB protein